MRYPIPAILAAAAAIIAPALSAAPSSASKIHPSLRQASGLVDVVVRLKEKPLAAVLGRNAKHAGARLSPAQQRSYVARLTRKQDEVMRAIAALGGGEQGRAKLAANVVMATIDAAHLERVAALGYVSAISPVVDYETDLASSVPYIGAAAVQAAGNGGAGVIVAVLDSGIDYTHAALGGAGTLAAYAAAYGTDPSDPANTTRDGLFPTAKVVEGIDLVGEDWPNSDLAPDDDPIDFEGHGTHVADISAGVLGVAPGASLWAVKVCSAVASSCSGVAMFEGLDYVLDPDGNGTVEDNTADVVNMSLGASYGQIEDDSVLAVELVSFFGITVVCSAGNSADKPYVTGTPGASPSALSVAQTTMPGEVANALKLTGLSNRPLIRRNTASVPWAPIDVAVNGPVVAVGIACAPLAPGSLAGKVALIDRGSCSISWKVDHAAKAGAVGVIVANNVAGDPPSFSFGGTSDGSSFLGVPTVIITQNDGRLIKSALNRGLAVNAEFGPGLVTALDGSMVASSSRGPSYGTQLIKPEIGAPGASVSAEVGTGTGTTPFGGTSGASPMVAGSAALVLAQYPGLSPLEVKARLMNAAEKNVLINPTTLPGVLAPITRIGAGEVRVDDAIALKAVAYEKDGVSAALSFGFHTLHPGTANTFTRTVEVKNYGAASRTYAIANLFRYANDAASGAALVNAPPTVTVPPGGTASFDVTVEVKPDRLQAWPFDIGAQGGNGPLLQTVEFDGHIVLTETTDGEKLCVPWHILPRRSADNEPDTLAVDVSGGPENINLGNAAGAQAGTSDIFYWTGDSPLDYPPGGAGIGANIALVDLRHVGVRTVVSGGTPFIQVAISTWDPRSHGVYPAAFEVWFDKDADGIYDSAVYTRENGAFASTGQTVAYGGPLTHLGGSDYDFSGVTGPRTFVDGDLNSSVVVISMPLSVLGLTTASKVGVAVVAADNYFTGFITDMIPFDGNYPPAGSVITLNQPHFTTSTLQTSVPVGGSAAITAAENPAGAAASPDQLGLLLFHRQAVLGREVDAVEVTSAPLP
ncbi:MAG: S8 family serine peptidase [Limisphaerales bacterium]